jgi:hypothetical protein
LSNPEGPVPKFPQYQKEKEKKKKKEFQGHTASPIATRKHFDLPSMSRALQSFRSCTASLSSRTFSRPPADVFARRHRLTAAAKRRFSDDKGSSEEVKDEVKEGSTETEKVELELLSQLKSKESEVVDLTVGIF